MCVGTKCLLACLGHIVFSRMGTIFFYILAILSKIKPLKEPGL